MGATGFRLLGPLEVRHGDHVVSVGGPRRRTLLGVLLVNRNEVVSVERLVDEAWQGEPPPGGRDTLQANLAHLRRALAGLDGVAIERQAPGYRLVVPGELVDVGSFETLVELGRKALADGRPAEAASALRSALDLCEGTPLGGVDDAPSVVAERLRLEHLRRDVTEDLAEADLQDGDAAAAVPLLEALLVEDPWRERATAQLMIALYRCGRQVDALAAYTRLREALAEELGLTPSPELRALEGDILRQDAQLETRIGVVGLDAGPGADVLPFVGRDAELAQLIGGFESVVRGEPAVALIGGEAGAGKTRLARELALAAPGHGATVLWGRCDEEPLAPYQPFLEAIGGYVDRAGLDVLHALPAADVAELVRVIPRLADHLPDAATPAPSASPEFERLRLFDAIVSFLRAVGPAVLVLDDLQWADQATVVLLRHVLRASDNGALFVLMTAREGEAGTGAVTALLADAKAADVNVVHVALEGLDATAIEALVRAAWPGRSDERTMAEELWRTTDGNPFFVRELLRADGDELPATVRGAILNRLGRLDTPVLNAVNLAAVLGEEFDLDVLAAMLEQDETAALAQVEAALGAGVVVETGAADRFRFAHGLVRRCLLEDLTASRRVRFHHLAGVAVERLRADDLGAHAGDLAYHFGEAAKAADARRAVEYARLAGTRAMGMLAYEEAADHFRHALDGMNFTSDPDIAARGDVLLSLGGALNRIGNTGEAESVLRSAVDAAASLGDSERLAIAALEYGGQVIEPGPADPARVALLDRALDALGDESTALRAKVLAKLAEALEYAPGDRALEVGREAVTVARASGDDTALAAALYANVSIHFVDGSEGRRLSEADELVALAQRIGDRHLELLARAWLMMGMLETGDGEGFDASLTVIVAAADELRQPLYQWGAAGFSATRAILRGDFARAETCSADALAVGDRAPEQAFATYVVQLLAIRWLQGRLAEMAPMLQAVGASSPATEITFPAWQAAQVWVAAQLGDEAAVRDALRELAAGGFADVGSGPFWAPGIALVSEACAFFGEPDAAAALYDRLLPLSGEGIVVGRASVCLGAADRYLGLLATRLERWEAADAHFTAATAFNKRLSASPFIALTQHGHAAMLRARGDAARADALDAEWRATASALGMDWLAAIEN